eukprot:1767908-Amphidinium_carterae.1
MPALHLGLCCKRIVDAHLLAWWLGSYGSTLQCTKLVFETSLKSLQSWRTTHHDMTQQQNSHPIPASTLQALSTFIGLQMG